MIGMADALAQEVKPYGIIIATICPEQLIPALAW